ncbi:hypothetical protein [Mycolicibacterium sp. P9-22]|uniref:hypothetical protein n=1 Tax=Mycolicibacterium sp. P9-22 TaxID=2024613 RepID=UPI0011ED47C7|nr:hypothetical protein [Mycolicibacterium sp. P9-22]KAA0108505.1 hypothetical protein CIW51_32270 [Mycolicibacterium sp. P9-22]
MNLQSRSKRWLAMTEVTQAFTGGMLISIAAMRQHGRELPLRDQLTLVRQAPHNDLKLTIEADPVEPGMPLSDVLSDVERALNNFTTGVEFEPTLRALDASLEKANVALREWTGDDQLRIEEIVSDLERAFLLSLIITLTSQTYLVDWDDKWRGLHEDFLTGKIDQDVAHYVDIETMIPCFEAGPGRVHAQHIHSALRSGTTMFIAGAPPMAVDHYPEFQSIIYSQWFAYMHAIWDEQFREKIATYFSTEAVPLEKDDVLNDFFGDIRLIRNDYVHNQGVTTDAVKCKLPLWQFEPGKPLNITTEQMVALIELFPRDALAVKPTPRPAQTRANVPGSIDLRLKEAFVKRAKELKVNRGAAIDEAINMWLASKADA